MAREKYYDPEDNTVKEMPGPDKMEWMVCSVLAEIQREWDEFLFDDFAQYLEKQKGRSRVLHCGTPEWHGFTVIRVEQEADEPLFVSGGNDSATG